MKLPLNDGDALIRAVLLEQWHLEVTGIHFIPIGDSAYSYRVDVQPNSSYYLKVVDQRMAAGQKTAAHMEFSLPLQHLVAQLHLAGVKAPLPQPTITGALHAIHEPFLFALYTFIHGETLADAYPMSPTLVRRIGQALAALHAVKIPEALRQRSPRIVSLPHLMQVYSPIWQHSKTSPLTALSFCNDCVELSGRDESRSEHLWPTATNMQRRRITHLSPRSSVTGMPGVAT